MPQACDERDASGAFWCIGAGCPSGDLLSWPASRSDRQRFAYAILVHVAAAAAHDDFAALHEQVMVG